MAKAGWLTIRNVPEPPKASGRNPYSPHLEKFFKTHKICPVCSGLGYLPGKGGVVRAETNVRLQGISSLEKLKSNESVPISDVIRELLEFVLCGRRPCTSCHGLRFIPKIKKFSDD